MGGTDIELTTGWYPSSLPFGRGIVRGEMNDAEFAFDVARSVRVVLPTIL